MNFELSETTSPKVRTFYALSLPQHRILLDFYTSLPEEQYDACLVDTPQRKADTPRQSLAHILYVQLVYLRALQTGKLEFKSMGTEGYEKLPKERLLAAWERTDQEMLDFLTAPSFDSERTVEVPWGGRMNGIDLLFFLRDHEILHIGWNLAVMDYLDLPRYPSLIQYWGP